MDLQRELRKMRQRADDNSIAATEAAQGLQGGCNTWVTKEYRSIHRVLWTGAAVAVLGVAALASGIATNHDSSVNADSIGACAPGYAPPSAKVGDVPGSFAAMQTNVSHLIANMGLTSFRDPEHRNLIADQNLTPQQANAAAAVMRVVQQSGLSWFDTYQSRVDQLGEDFCLARNETYAKPGYLAAQSAVRLAGFKVTVEPNSLGPITATP